MTHLNSRVARIVAGLAVVSAFAVAPMAAQANDTALTGTLGAGSLTVGSPTITPFTGNVTGITRSLPAAMSTWNFTDARGSDAGYIITAAATPLAIVGAAGATTGTGATVDLTPPAVTATTGNPAANAPVPELVQNLDSTSTIYTAATDAGQGSWDVGADADNLQVTIPGDADAGAYSTTLTFTNAPYVAP